MKKIKNIIFYSILLYILVFQIKPDTLLAQENCFDYSNIPNAEKILNFSVNNKPISYVLNKIAFKANFNLIIKPEFKDANISLTFKNTSVSDALNNLMTLGSFVLKQDGKIIIATTEIKPEIISEIVPLQNSQAMKISYILDKSVRKDAGCQLNYDDITNSVIIQGSPNFIESTKKIIEKLDKSKQNLSLKLSNTDCERVASIIKNQLSVTDLNDTSLPTLDLSYDNSENNENLKGIIKATIEKEEFPQIYQEKPIILSDNKNNTITIIGNSYQVSLVKDLVTYLDKSNEPLQDFSTISKLNKDLDETKSTLLDSLKLLEKRNDDLKIAFDEIKNLKIQLNDVKSKKLWDIFTNLPSEKLTDNNSITIDNLKNQISELKTKSGQAETNLNAALIAKSDLEKLLLEKNIETESLFNQLKQTKDQLTELMVKNELKFKNSQEAMDSTNSIKEELATTRQELINTKQQLNEVTQELNNTKKELEISNSKNQKETIAMLTMTQEELVSTKKELVNTKIELNRTTELLNISKKQLEMIFGGTLLDELSLKNTNSRWFK